ncbi:unnamed protein product [Aspergillus oryzae var. brunneus]|uniref:Unnamed protein product n=1 Tax=Aspergillus oryzae var. brunneus TaxID=332754 RepID=A0ABQ6KWP1_ASPOZ|nr:unnamed protein product [Aspergillus oryzae var. brunneus]
MDCITQSSVHTSKSHPLQIFHRYNHQRATQHLIELYEAYTSDPTDEQKLLVAIEKIDSINSRIRDLNEESQLPLDSGVIDYGVFIYGWERNKTDNSKQQLEVLCRRNQYMKGWSCIPPHHDYGYFDYENNKTLSVILPLWLQLVWALLKKKQLDFVDDVEVTLLSHASSEACSLQPVCLDIPTVLSLLHQMGRLLDKGKKKQNCVRIASEYEDTRETIRRMFKFEGFQTGWIPSSMEEEQTISR